MSTPQEWQPGPALRGLLQDLAPLRKRLLGHGLYRELRADRDVRVFMEHHVFAVWDFMSLLKALQRELTCVGLPWLPRGAARTRRLINEIVLDEESDEIPGRGCFSHFELYRLAMEACGADRGPIDAFVEALRSGVDVPNALGGAGTPGAARDFVLHTWDVLSNGGTHGLAAAFTIGREEVIPDIFRALVTDLERRHPGRYDLLSIYLERHIEVDSEHHGPLALQMLEELCGDVSGRWEEALAWARSALEARLALWDGTLAVIRPDAERRPRVS